MTPRQQAAQEKVDHAVILAAGTGVRFKEATNSFPKPLLEVAGVPLIERTIRTAQRAGIRRFTIISGYQGDKLEAFLKSNTFMDVEIQCVWNAAWERPNGVSAKLAAGLVPQRFVLLMADHLFDAAILNKLLRRRLPTGHCRLAVDGNPDRVLDLADATKVRMAGDRVVEIGKSLENYNAIDTGIFLCSDALFDGLGKAISRGEESLTDGIRELAREGRMEAVDIGGFFWQDIDTERDLRYGEEQLLRSPTNRAADSRGT
jgi:1L-myo-inositol 1-phosphate cytidylyltransferase